MNTDTLLTYLTWLVFAGSLGLLLGIALGLFLIWWVTRR